MGLACSNSDLSSGRLRAQGALLVSIHVHQGLTTGGAVAAHLQLQSCARQKFHRLVKSFNNRRCIETQEPSEQSVPRTSC
ncbi:hypothetical protein VFPPC_16732 [Pochonia chlamydosporia 170]|uniref:Uncharacterized protein n=1 Tax=Pochonia chlamydosporia 170 TaxID=1380566 RepID=A0A179F5U4_METCM|nr:hypothetical protein VFPPC_16732 [Pochonia chlamydosporia 170]OAQ60489.1 hypothetical protein VFPPC_16732 [Pochonia chlamydosporia 170]